MAFCLAKLKASNIVPTGQMNYGNNASSWLLLTLHLHTWVPTVLDTLCYNVCNYYNYDINHYCIN